MRLSAGRNRLSREAQALCYFAGANSIFYGDKLLTASNRLRTRTGISCELSIFNRNLLLLTATCMKIAIGSDHAGFFKQRIIEYLKEKGHEVLDFGTHSADSTDYPLWIIPTAEAVAKGEAERGIVRGFGNGEAIAANKVKGIRCGLCWSDETAALSRQHNNANVLSMGERMISIEMALRIVDIWLTSSFEGGRHAGRIEQLARYEAGQPMR